MTNSETPFFPCDRVIARLEAAAVGCRELDRAVLPSTSRARGELAIRIRAVEAEIDAAIVRREDGAS